MIRVKDLLMISCFEYAFFFQVRGKSPKLLDCLQSPHLVKMTMEKKFQVLNIVLQNSLNRQYD